MATRTLSHVIPSVPTSDGGGVKLRRSLGSQRGVHVDPFLMLDEFYSDNPDDYLAGFPAHPHRGFETVTYMLDGHMRHEDHLGNRGDLGETRRRAVDDRPRGASFTPRCRSRRKGACADFSSGSICPRRRRGDMKAAHYRGHSGRADPVGRAAAGRRGTGDCRHFLARRQGDQRASQWRGREAHDRSVLPRREDLPAGAEFTAPIPSDHNATCSTPSRGQRRDRRGGGGDGAAAPRRRCAVGRRSRACAGRRAGRAVLAAGGVRAARAGGAIRSFRHEHAARRSSRRSPITVTGASRRRRRAIRKPWRGTRSHVSACTPVPRDLYADAEQDEGRQPHHLTPVPVGPSLRRMILGVAVAQHTRRSRPAGCRARARVPGQQQGSKSRGRIGTQGERHRDRSGTRRERHGHWIERLLTEILGTRGRRAAVDSSAGCVFGLFKSDQAIKHTTDAPRHLHGGYREPEEIEDISSPRAPQAGISRRSNC